MQKSRPIGRLAVRRHEMQPPSLKLRRTLAWRLQTCLMLALPARLPRAAAGSYWRPCVAAFAATLMEGVMTYPRATAFIPALLALTALVATDTTAARAQNVTFVSSSGADANACTAPATACASFAGAQTKTADGGAIMCVNPGSFGGVIIAKSITIDCLAGGGSLNAQTLIINAPGKTVRLRNLAANGISLLGPVLDIEAAASVHLENVLVTGSTGLGIYDHRAGPAKLLISNSSIEANPGAGIVIAPSSGIIGAVLDNVRSNNNGYGVAVGAGGRVMINRSVFSWNATTGIHADAGAVIEVNDTLASHNQFGINANNGSTVAIATSGINSNTTGISGTTQTYGNNRIFANSNNGTAPVAFGAASSEFGLR
jgi:hypothetical protein